MSVIEVEKLLQEISAEAPCGEDLEYDTAFGEMARAAQGRPEQQMGDTLSEAEEPAWREVRGKALDLLSRTKDLRVGVYLARALVHTDGLPGLGDSLALLKGFVERYWETVHPQLDPEDGNDPTMRVNTLTGLCDPEAVLNTVREAPLVSSRALGRFSLRDVEIASGKLAAPSGDGTPPDMAAIDAAFLDCDLEELQGTADAVGRSIQEVRAIESLVTEQVGVAQAPDLGALPDLLKSAQQLLSEQLARRGVGEEGEAAVAAGAPKPITGEINSREDVVRVLDKACDYFTRHEPTSPVPLLLRRAKRLISKDFMGIMRDLAPNGVSQAETITGADREE